jgi:hypothetical protein
MVTIVFTVFAWLALTGVSGPDFRGAAGYVRVTRMASAVPTGESVVVPFPKGSSSFTGLRGPLRRPRLRSPGGVVRRETLSNLVCPPRPSPP